jgi:hypothetical protein
MKNFINGIQIDETIYDNWPEALKDCAAVYVPEKTDSPHNLIIIKSSETYPSQTIKELEEFPEEKIIARILWVEDEKNAPVVGLEVNEDYQNMGVGTFLCILARTWVAEKFSVSIMAPEFYRSPPVEQILKTIVNDYKEETILLRTSDGKYKTLSDTIKQNDESVS